MKSSLKFCQISIIKREKIFSKTKHFCFGRYAYVYLKALGSSGTVYACTGTVFGLIIAVKDK
jgi:hypothetical protein